MNKNIYFAIILALFLSACGSSPDIFGNKMTSAQPVAEMEAFDMALDSELQMMVAGAPAPTMMAKNRMASPMMMTEPMPMPPVQNSETYDKVEENSFKSVSTDPLSTFSVDVDTASYSNIRRFINDNSLPPKDGIRLEEMINYFDYDYTNLDEDIKIFTELGTPIWNKNDTKNQLLKIGLQAKQIDKSKLPNSNLVYLIDVSGSMSSPNKIELVKKSLKLLTKNLNSNDRVAIVTYAGTSQVALESTKINESGKYKVLSLLDSLSAGGGTNGQGGIELAYEQAKKGFIKDGNNRIILLTDGDFNIGARSPNQLLEIAEEKRETGIFLTVLGFGMGNYRDNMIEKLANSGNGNYAYIDTILEAKKTLINELVSNLFTIAKDVKIQVEFNPKYVKEYRLIGYENRKLNNEDFTNDKKDAGEIGVSHAVTALYEIVPNSDEVVKSELKYQTAELSESANSNELATVKIRYKKPDSDTSSEFSKVVTNKVSENSQDLNFASAVAGFGMILKESQFVKNLTLDKVIKLAKDSKGKDENCYRAEFIRLAETVKLIKESSSDSE